MQLNTHRVTIREVVAQTAAAFAMRPEDILGDRRHKHVTLARHAAFYLARTLTSNSMPEIARRMGGRDHTTVLNGIRRISRLLNDDQQLAKRLNELAQKMKHAPCQ